MIKYLPGASLLFAPSPLPCQSADMPDSDTLQVQSQDPPKTTQPLVEPQIFRNFNQNLTILKRDVNRKKITTRSMTQTSTHPDPATGTKMLG